MSRAEIKALIIQMSAYYGQKFEDPIILMYTEDLADLPVSEIARVMNELRRDPKITRFPLPAMIRDRLTPAVTPENEALEAISRVIAAVSNIGPYQIEKARAAIGELGWEVVKAEGGWENVCQNLTEDNIGMLRAQWKSIALAKMARAKAGLIDGPSLPEPAMQAKQIEIKNMVSRFALPMPKGDV